MAAIVRPLVEGAVQASAMPTPTATIVGMAKRKRKRTA
jgi:hypothetical protein